MHSVIAAIPEAELLELARRFAEPGDGGHDLQRVHAIGGHLAATDDRILLHVESPAVRDIGESSPKILGFRPEQAVRVAGADWVMDELAPRVSAEYGRAEERLLEKRKDAIAEARGRTRTCPHCGTPFVVDEDGDLRDIDEYLAGELPDMAHDGPAAWLRFGNDRLARKVGLHYLATALDAARRLGGDAELWIGERIQVILWGVGWFIVIAMMRRDEPHDEHDIDIEVPKEDTEK